jgi:hypothetical protein
LTAHTANPETGAKTATVVETTVRWMFKQPTQYSRLYRAQQTQTRIGDTTFIMWLPDVEAVFTTLTQEDFITYDGGRYEVVTSGIEDTAFVVTARKFE